MARWTTAVATLALALCASCGGGGGGSGGGGGGGGETPVLRVTSPNGGEIWAVPGPHTVTWETGTYAGLLDVELSSDGGAGWAGLATGLSNSGSATLQVPSSFPPGSQYRLRLSASDAGAPPVTPPSDESDADFTVAAFLTEVGGPLTGVALGDVAWGDVDGDGDLDLVVVGYDGMSGTAKLYLDTGGAFSETPTSIIPSSQAHAAWADVDGDGDLDLVVNGFISGSTFSTQVLRNEAGGLVASGVVLPGSVNGTLSWGDFDNDGDLDLAMIGSEPNGATTRILVNEPGSTFSDSGIPLPGYEFGTVEWGDYDADGDLDLALAGQSPPFSNVKVYRQDAPGIFSDAGVALDGLYGTSAAWSDFDGDGDLDLAVVGPISSGVYRNDAGAFHLTAPLPSLLSTALAWGDYDADGDLDLVVCGNGGVATTILLRNDGGIFVDSGVALPQVSGGAVAWGDFDHDGAVDLAICGQTGAGAITKVLRNMGPKNTPPTAPTGVDPITYTGGVTILWDPATDAQTPSAGLSYNVSIQSLPSFAEVAPGMALGDGRRLLPARGRFSVQHAFGAAAFDLPPGVYLARIQAIDTSFAGGPWSPSVQFTVP